ncbi:C6 zinc finger domain-containing protein [Fusarium mexicanum]|uniref:C6 zinc finger domain-containing protein n=1 Tax=Fusarium mexicanum TaxID=751941 RepID=A0A8H5IW44_9HYPO|nr:C6 zinc finger domain-containing protein [Fusarium mexicanum]
MGLQDDLRSVWKTAIPQQGYSHPYVMHGIMAISALHKAYLLYNKGDEYLTLAAYHYTRGQADFRKALLAVTDNNCKPVFCFSLILIVYMCSVPVTRAPGHVIENPIQATLELFLVCRGLRETTKSHYDRALKSDLFPLVRSSWLTGDEDPLKIPTPSLQTSPLPADTFKAIDTLKDFLQSHMDMAHIAEAEDALSCLRVTAVNVAMAGINVELGNVVLWPHHFSDAFMADMKHLRPYALLILAYFTPILAVVDRNFWFLHGWSKYLLADIEERLSDLPEFARNLEWPKAHVT